MTLTTPNPDFKVTQIVDAEIISVTVEDRDIFTMEDPYEFLFVFGRRIGTRMRSIEWCHFQ